ncbi:hypothetical protein [Actinomadura miaoliensis]|uniref:Uncharacterized protein n=1 Tax=Actinomadura miaoliensis TaxID=430685 RepID=A0ABP7W759_9ACTN
MIDCLDDIRSDLSVLHRIDDMEGMDAARFFSFCERLHAYQGAVRMRAEENSQRRSSASAPARPQPQKTYYNDIADNPAILQFFGKRRDR